MNRMMKVNFYKILNNLEYYKIFGDVFYIEDKYGNNIRVLNKNDENEGAEIVFNLPQLMEDVEVKKIRTSLPCEKGCACYVKRNNVLAVAFKIRQLFDTNMIIITDNGDNWIF